MRSIKCESLALSLFWDARRTVTRTCAKASTTFSTRSRTLPDLCRRIQHGSTYSLALQSPRVFPCPGYDGTRAGIEAMHGGEGTEGLSLPPPPTMAAAGSSKIRPIHALRRAAEAVRLPCSSAGGVEATRGGEGREGRRWGRRGGERMGREHEVGEGCGCGRGGSGGSGKLRLLFSAEDLDRGLIP
ncbi:unnamed protein product [Miscanthus lutarioriparius]|uniref:Uncharacterized protein n=1 Tax=Miscanthus lutarioriparius TaxID=422564 RepID=A0A811QFQ0_9POAL|nr:unnamed protein product [Miscanthus lutarioriparius]